MYLGVTSGFDELHFDLLVVAICVYVSVCVSIIMLDKNLQI